MPPSQSTLRQARTFGRGILVFSVVCLAACSSHSSGAKSTSTTAPPFALPANTATATVSGIAAQTIDGFGASGAWWPIDLEKFPASVRGEVGRMLFSAGGIALSGYRYNIGGGGKGVTTPDRAPKQYPADTAGLLFLQMAADAHVPLLTGFANSAPPRFTTNHQACGGALLPGMESEYADYLAGVVRSIHDDHHITLNYVSPMNEPDDAFPDCGQEGMRVPVVQRATVVRALGQALARDAPFAKTIADETTADSIAANEDPTWLAVPGTTQYLAAIAHHTYDFPNDALRKLLPPVSARAHTPTWMTETCCYKGSGGVASSFGAQFDPTMTQALWLADQIEGDLTVARDGAWYWWTALSPVLGCDPVADKTCPTRVNPKGFNDGLLYYDKRAPAHGTTRIFTTKRFFALGQFSRYVRPGARRHDVANTPKGVRAMAFSHGKDWTVVTWNERTSPTRYALVIPQRVTALAAVITNGANELQHAVLPALTTTGAWLVDLPGRTIATYSFRTS